MKHNNNIYNNMYLITIVVYIFVTCICRWCRMTGFFEPLILLKLMVARILLNRSAAVATDRKHWHWFLTTNGRLWDMIGLIFTLALTTPVLSCSTQVIMASISGQQECFGFIGNVNVYLHPRVHLYMLFSDAYHSVISTQVWICICCKLIIITGVLFENFRLTNIKQWWK